MNQLNTVFQALILNKIRYAIPAWSGFLSVHLVSQINGLLKRYYKYGYCLKINTLEEVIESAHYKLLEAYKINNTASILFSVQPNHLAMTLDPKDITIRSQTTPQNSITDLSFHILCFSITDFTRVIIFNHFLYALCFCFFCVEITAPNRISSVHCLRVRLLHVH